MEGGSQPATPAGASEKASRPPPLSLGLAPAGEEESLWRSKPATPHRLSCSSVGTAVQSAIACGDINEFQMYQRFRLKMVQMFGSLSSALYEFGADTETGEIPRLRFEEVCAGRLGLLSPLEANLLFSHVTNADPLDQGLGGRAYPRNFGISDEEWRMLVLRKKREKEGETGAMPFSSGPTGSSMGSYHRAIHVGGSREQQTPRRDAPGSPGTRASVSASSASGGGGGGSPLPAGESSTAWVRQVCKRQQRRAGSSFPWRQPQKPWARSILAGEDVLGETQGFWSARGQERGQRFSTSGHASMITAQPKHHQLGETHRQGPQDVGFLPGSCPTRRREMEPSVCARQAEVWWPYASPRPKLRLATPRCR